MITIRTIIFLLLLLVNGVLYSQPKNTLMFLVNNSKADTNFSWGANLAGNMKNYFLEMSDSQYYFNPKVIKHSMDYVRGDMMVKLNERVLTSYDFNYKSVDCLFMVYQNTVGIITNPYRAKRIWGIAEFYLPKISNVELPDNLMGITMGYDNHSEELFMLLGAHELGHHILGFGHWGKEYFNLMCGKPPFENGTIAGMCAVEMEKFNWVELDTIDLSLALREDYKDGSGEWLSSGELSIALSDLITTNSALFLKLPRKRNFIYPNRMMDSALFGTDHYYVENRLGKSAYDRYAHNVQKGYIIYQDRKFDIRDLFIKNDVEEFKYVVEKRVYKTGKSFTSNSYEFRILVEKKTETQLTFYWGDSLYKCTYRNFPDSLHEKPNE